MIIKSVIEYMIDGKKTLICAKRHADVIQKLHEFGFKPRTGYKELRQGFIDDKGNFMDRHEAYIHAVNNHQIDEKDEQILFSEDLW